MDAPWACVAFISCRCFVVCLCAANVTLEPHSHSGPSLTAHSGATMNRIAHYSRTARAGEL